MYIFFSAETYTPAGDLLRPIQNDVDDKLSFITQRGIGLEEVNNYGTEFKDVIIVTICIPQEDIDVGWFKERVLIKRKAHEADIRLRMDYDKFINASPELQRLMYIENIVRSIRAIQSRSKADFRGEKLIKDILKTLDVVEGDLKKI